VGSRSDKPASRPGVAQRRAWERRLSSGLASEDQGSSLVRSARAFAALIHAGQRRESDAAPFIRHPSEVAQLLGDAGCSDVVVAAGLLHDIVDGTRVTVARLATLFGGDVANLVAAVSEDPSIPTYRQRKRELRERVHNAGRDAALLFAATKIAEVRELPHRLRRDDERCDTTAPAHRSRMRDRLQRSHQLHMEHYHASLHMLQDVASEHPLVKQLARELNNAQIAIAHGTTSDHA
jgi:(p)ppGpp synthase/HD superfamily hydrolase